TGPAPRRPWTGPAVAPVGDAVAVNTTGAPSQPRTVAVDVVDPDLDADVRAVLAALALDPRPRDGGPVEVLVTDRPADTAAAGPTRLVRVAGDGTGDDDEVVLLPSGTARLVGLLSTPVESSGSLVAVVGAVGGCGTSTVAAALAVRASGRGRTLLVEADPRGPGIDLLLGSEAEPGLRVGDVRSDLGGPRPGRGGRLGRGPDGGAGDAVRSSARGGAGAPGCGRTRGLRRGPGRAWGPVAGARGPRRRRHRLRPPGGGRGGGGRADGRRRCDATTPAGARAPRRPGPPGRRGRVRRRRAVGRAPRDPGGALGVRFGRAGRRTVARRGWPPPAPGR